MKNSKEEPKQETLEEAALKYASEKLRRVIIPYKEFNANVAEYVGFVNGAKWQAERMYSEEDIDKLISNFKHDLKESTSTCVKQNCEGAIFGLERLKQFKKK